MPKQNNAPLGGPFIRLLTLPNEHPAKTVTIALILCLVCSALVSTAAVLLKPRQLANEELLAKQREILRTVGRYQEETQISAAFSNVETHLVNLTSGEYVTDIDVDSYDYNRAILDPATRVEIAPQDDIARVYAIARYAPVYLFKDQGVITHIVIPVYGYGLWSTMRAYLAVRADGNHIAGISFYQQGETPGLGDEVVNPRWQAKWKDKRIYDTQGKVRLALVKNPSKDQDASAYQIDALSGATLTSNGVTNLIQFWLGDQGYGPYFKRHFKRETGE